jgi:beta-N-acetylhexosaminidase
MAVAAGTDLLCFGRDTGEETYLGVRDALVEAVRSGRLPGSRLEESAVRIAGLRQWMRAARQPAPATAGPIGPHIGLTAARRALRIEGAVAPMTGAVLVEIVPPSNIAVGTVPWGLGTWVPADRVRRISTNEAPAPAVAQALAAAAGRPLLVVVRDAHRHRVARDVVTALHAERPDTVVVEMGLPVWHPPAGVYLVTYGATRASSRAAAEQLGLIQEVGNCGPDRP